ncbi:unnamed protein product, partial [Ostreobium quekettii]
RIAAKEMDTDVGDFGRRMERGDVRPEDRERLEALLRRLTDPAPPAAPAPPAVPVVPTASIAPAAPGSTGQPILMLLRKEDPEELRVGRLGPKLMPEAAGAPRLKTGGFDERWNRREIAAEWARGRRGGAVLVLTRGSARPGVRAAPRRSPLACRKCFTVAFDTRSAECTEPFCHPLM